ncbi:hypothetical protein [Bacteriovorax sp. Seq25_V]|uniref:hypothetical protein n=1 Tax=Bacteriovorax sp. Seq25_V TaxID=1201288 RepID=UPI00038A3B30|nr:hypothetical protein [Bacteriovorax sp. Seq25_V]EQC47131.1 hypothetical protein M900_0849 [Bacteriovorax sp. Seq25_V]
MKKILLLTFISFLTVASDLQTGISLFNQNKYNEATKALIKVAPKSAGFKRSLEVQAVIYYKTENYQKLLSTALFYRKHFLTHEDFNTKVLGLELLTLNKMCHYEAVQNILTNVKAQTKLDLTELEKSLQIAKKFSITTNLAPAQKYSKRDLWKIESEQIINLKTPYELVIRLENRCQG